jgi:hypothetical protein
VIEKSRVPLADSERKKIGSGASSEVAQVDSDEDGEDYDLEVYDDRHFYSQMLKVRGDITAAATVAATTVAAMYMSLLLLTVLTLSFIPHSSFTPPSAVLHLLLVAARRGVRCTGPRQHAARGLCGVETVQEKEVQSECSAVQSWVVAVASRSI